MEYITTKEASAKWGISPTRITILANEGRIPGAHRIGRNWMIPVHATKPVARKGGRTRIVREQPDNFSFPLYPYRPDWNSAKESLLSEQQKSLLTAEIAVLECRFDDAYPLLQSILLAPENIATEIACLWNAAICCIARNKPDAFSGFFLRLQMLLSEDFPHRDDLAITLDCLKTYVEPISSASSSMAFNPDIHEQALPVACVLMGYAHLTGEVMKPGSAEVPLLEINLRFLKSTGSVFAVELMHIYLLGIYSLRQNTAEAERHAKAVVQLAYENKLYFPLVTYYSYNIPVFSSILEQYPKDFQKFFRDMVSQYGKNYASFTASMSGRNTVSTLTDKDYPYALGVLMGLSNSQIAVKTGVSQPTVKRKLDKLCEKLNVRNKKELKDLLQRYM